MARRDQEFQTIRSEGGLLPVDLLRRVLDRNSDLAGTKPEDYRLPAEERIEDVITQAWDRLRKHWREFRTATAELPATEAGTGITNERWNLPLLRALDFGLLPTTAGPQIEGHAYAIRRFSGATPVHLIGCGLALDRRSAGHSGAAATNPHGLVQDFLNRSDAHLWGLLSNGLCLRVLRDNQALSRQSFLEFDLEAMMDGELYADFVLLWRVAHASRFFAREEDRPETCWLEQWSQEAQKQGTRVLEDLRGGVEKALEILGAGFTSRNPILREALRSGQLLPTELHAQLLRLVYRFIFLFVSEDRSIEGKALLHSTDAADEARECYVQHYSTARLRIMAGKIKGSRHDDLWRQFQIVVNALSGADASQTARKQLALPALGSLLWDPDSTAVLSNAELSNFDLLEALRHLAFTRQGKVLRPVDYKNLGAEELGGVYESLLGLTPRVGSNGTSFEFAEFAGNERKTSGSYYTPDSLVQCLLDSALDPVIEAAVKGKLPQKKEQAILALKICDPAVGSGHFLVGAAHRLARRLAQVRALAEGESEPSPLRYQQALRDVIGRCLYGVDVNPMAAELCRVSLWLEALQPGKPLSFLDNHIRVGNSLLGATPELIKDGLPDAAFKPITGDDREICLALKKQNRQERDYKQRDLGLPMAAEPQAEYNSLADRSQGINEAPDDTLEAIQRKAELYRRMVVSPKYRRHQEIADAWCAAFVWPKTPDAPSLMTTDTLWRLEEDAEALDAAQRKELQHLAAQYQFFHWHLAFPEISTQGGFDCMLGNPPWERVKLQEKEWFAERNAEVANALHAAARKRLIEKLKDNDPVLHQDFLKDVRKADGESHLLRNSGRYPLCGRGDINLYMVFAEGLRLLLNETGRTGAVLPTGIATDDTTKLFFQDVVRRQSLVSLFDFENKKIFFPEVHSSYKFCLFTAGIDHQPIDVMEFIFYAHSIEELRNPERRFSLSSEDIALLNPNTHTCPIFRLRKDVELTKAIYRRAPVLIRETQEDGIEQNPWGIKFSTMFHMSSDSHLFCTREQLEEEGWELEGNIFYQDGKSYLPLYEGKMNQIYNHRAADLILSKKMEKTKIQIKSLESSELGIAERTIIPRYWIPADICQGAIEGLWEKEWLLGFSEVTNSTNERTMKPALFLFSGVSHKMPLILGIEHTANYGILYAIFSSFIFDFVVRQKIGGVAISFYHINQFPVLSINSLSSSRAWIKNQTIKDWLHERLLELIYTAWDIQPFAQDCGWNGPPFRWDEERRFQIRCELDAAFFHLYLPIDESGNWRPARKSNGCPHDETPEQLEQLKHHFPTPRDAVPYIMDTFPIVRRKDEKAHGHYRTKQAILHIYDAMQESIRTGNPYQSPLDPPPGPPKSPSGHFLNYNQIAQNPPPHLHPPKIEPILLTHIS